MTRHNLPTARPTAAVASTAVTSGTAALGALLAVLMGFAALTSASHASEVPGGAYYDGGYVGDTAVQRGVPTPAASQLYPPVNGIALRRSVNVTGPFVTLGDLFEGLPGKHEAVVARSPRPARQAVLDAPWLEKAAVAHGLKWRPNSAVVQITVNRPGETVPQRDIEAALLPVLQSLGAPSHMSIELSGTRTPISVPLGAPISIRVSEETYDPATKRFTAVIEAPAGSPDAQRVQLSGRFTDTRSVPVLTRRLSRGQVIMPSDVDFIDIRAEALSSGIIVDIDELIGKEPRNIVREGEPIRRSEILRPEVVRRNAQVTMELRMPGISVTARGKALEAGGEGDVIRVQNLNSKQVVLATVVDPSTVIVAPPASAAHSASRW